MRWLHPPSCMLVAGLAALPAQQEPSSQELAKQFLAAIEAHDLERMRAIATIDEFDRDPFLVADILLGDYRRNRGTPDGQRYLAAAGTLAGIAAATRRDLPGLPALVAAWASQDPEQLERRHAFRVRAYELRGQLEGTGLEGEARERVRVQALDAADELLATPMPAEVFSVLLAYTHALTLRNCWRPDEAEVSYQRCARLASAMGWLSIASRAMTQSCRCIHEGGDRRRAIEPLRDLIAQFEARGDERNATILRANLAELYEALGERDQWQDLHAPTLAKARELGVLGTVAQLRLGEADLHLGAGEPHLALAACERARADLEELDRQDKLHDPGYLALVDGARGRALVQLGRFGEALTALERAERVHRDRDKRLELVEDQLLLGATWLQLGRDRQARSYLEQAFANAREIRSLDGIARSRRLLGQLALEAGDGPKALADLQGVLAEVERLGARSAVLDVRLLVAEARQQLGDHEAAAAELETLIADAGSQQQHDLALQARLLLARSVLALGRPDDAVAELQRALQQAQDQRDRATTARALAQLAAAELARGGFEAAVAAAEQAIATQQALGRGLGADGGVGLRALVRDAADQGLRALLARQQRDGASATRTAKALHLCESARALLLAGALDQGAAPRSAAVPRQDLEAERAARQRVQELQRGLRAAHEAGDAAAEKAAASALDRAHAELDSAVARVQRAAGAASEAALPQPVSAADLGAGLPTGAALVLYHFAGPDLLALVARGDGLRLLRIGDAPRLGRQANAWRSLLADPDPSSAGAERQAAAALGAALLEPLADELRDGAQLWISPDGALAFVPFEALLAGGESGRRLVETCAVGYVPSATVALRLRERQRAAAPGVGFLALGDPVYPGETAGEPAAEARDMQLRDIGELRRLRHSGEEVQLVQSLFADPLPAGQRTVLLRQEATRANFVQALERSSQRLALAHLACHGFFDARWGELSGLVLGGGEVLSASEMARLRLPADLLVLSACRTGEGELQSGEGVMGLVRAAFLAGCHRIVVSQWSVEDRSACDFMRDFYRRLIAGGQPAADALRAAKRERIAAGGESARPFHWAGFVLWGAWD